MRPLTPPDRPSRLKLFLKRQKQLVRPLAGVLVLAALGGAAYRALQLPSMQARLAPLQTRLLGANALRVTAINIEGAQLTDEAAIRRALAISVGDPVLSFSVSGARDRLNALPFIDHVTVARHLSGEIDVSIVERPPYAVWQHQGHFTLIDRQGQPVPDQGANGKDAQAFTKLPLVVGEGANETATALIETVALEPELKARVTAAVRVSNRRWNLTLRDGTTILLPEGEETAAIHRLAQLNTTTQLLDRPVAFIDMRLPDRLTIRERPAPANDAQPGKDTQAEADMQAGAETTHPAADTPPGTPAARHPVAAPMGEGPAHAAHAPAKAVQKKAPEDTQNE
ncbi:cell division protein FtsQ/DivIB [Acetobacter sp. TBRC 12305]|uniref:Cell division protein FtsQ n=1 Tax=Acetobacter garciniae TaxID=2817435 RepID=A0A939HPN8_9PROT|nr:cell division protein FtsQ/DivIB [Acetobacter garciniae]MBO1326421.1 cell division protein FtsQ/DivIB [Acetobacter garciniae]MBX0346124.1 cell division protein FtsQ/DivIB [Acetobacter garciniae]